MIIQYEQYVSIEKLKYKLLAARGNPTLPPPVAEGGGQCLPLLRPVKWAVQRVDKNKRLKKWVR